MKAQSIERIHIEGTFITTSRQAEGDMTLTQENPIVIEDREELIFILSEAAALEHMIMCQYLYAAFSLKRDVSEGITAEQLEAIKRWERVVSHVATQEMLHLALVNNLLSAIGASPYFSRPNFPQKSRYYPPGVRLALLPFGQDALQHFLFLERPEGMELEDAPELEVLATPKPSIPLKLDDDQIVPQEQVFVGPRRAQATQEYFGWPELVAVTDLASAVQAIETIIEQGEGAQGDWSKAHYGKFLQIMQEYQQLKQQDPNFEPARPVLPAYVRPPSDTSEYSLIKYPLTAAISELFNASYEVLLQMLIRYFIHGLETEDQLRTLSSTAVDMMFVAIKPLGELLTTLPVGPKYPGKMAGASFEIYRTGYVLPHRRAAWIILRERLLEIATFCGKLCTQQSAPKGLLAVQENLLKLASTLEIHVNTNQA